MHSPKPPKKQVRIKGFHSVYDELVMDINKTTDESLESTRRVVALAEASKEAGTDVRFS